MNLMTLFGTLCILQSAGADSSAEASVQSDRSSSAGWRLHALKRLNTEYSHIPA